MLISTLFWMILRGDGHDGTSRNKLDVAGRGDKTYLAPSAADHRWTQTGGRRKEITAKKGNTHEPVGKHTRNKCI